MQETWVRSLDQEDLLEKEMASHSSILAWKIPWTEEPSGLQSMVFQDLATKPPEEFVGCSLWDHNSWTGVSD